MQVQILCEGHEPILATALVDTGCEVNLMRPNLLPPTCFTTSKTPARLRTANQSLMVGGHLEANVKLKFEGLDWDSEEPVSLELPFKRHNADMGHEILISYPWLVSMCIDILPRKQGLVVHHDDRVVWCPGMQEMPVWCIPVPPPSEPNLHCV